MPVLAAHTPVLLAEVVGAFPKHSRVWVDCTAGLGGHAAAIAAQAQPDTQAVLLDADATNLVRAASRVAQAAPHVRVHAVHDNFAGVSRHVATLDVRADFVLADLGFSSNQMDDAQRGFSMKNDGPLDMRLDASKGATAADLVASMSEADLARVIEEWGEDHAARRIARAVVQARANAPITTTGRLAEVVRSATSAPREGIDPATRTFQALRIAVNDELGCLDALLQSVLRDAQLIADGKPGVWLADGARVAIISFHSLEDRAVKKAFAKVCALGGRDISAKPITPTDEEVSANPRARSAKLRVVELPRQAAR